MIKSRLIEEFKGGDNVTAGRFASADVADVASLVADLLDDLLAKVFTKSSLSGFEFMPDAELVSLVSKFENLGRKVDSLRVGAAAQVAKRTANMTNADPSSSLSHAYGYKSARSFLQVLTKTSGAVINARLQLGVATSPRASLTGESLPENFPHVAKAVATGVIDTGAANVIVKHLNQLGDHVPYEKIRFAEERLVATATGNDDSASQDESDTLGASDTDSATSLPVHADDLKIIVNGWCTALDQDGKEPDRNAQDKRFFNIGSERNGLVSVKGALLPEVAAKLGRAFDAINNPRLKSDADSQTDTTFDDVQQQFLDSRSPAQLRHDALATAVGFALKNEEMPNLGGEAVTLVVQVKEENLLKENGHAWVEDSHGVLTPQHAGLARHAACVGGVLRVTQNSDGKIVALGNAGRVFNAKQRKAILLRDGGCVIPGCETPSTWCEIHHVEEHAKGGATHTDNGVTLCWYHHRHIEQHGWGVRIKNGTPHIRAPRWLDPGGLWRRHKLLHQPEFVDASNITKFSSSRHKLKEPKNRKTTVRFKPTMSPVA